MKRKTPKIYGVIGDPIEHSLSPQIQNPAFLYHKLNAIYLPFHVTKAKLKKFIHQIKEENIAGVNVTLPHKETVLQLMDHLSREARLCGAVNTIIKKGKKLYGHTTDGQGYLMSLEKEARFKVKNKNIIILGAGGAARSIAVATALSEAKHISIINRTETKAQRLCKDLSLKIKKVNFSSGNLKNFDQEHFQKCHLIINTTSMGMKGIPLIDLPWKNINSKALASDIVYKPKQTPFLKKAEKRGLKCHEGWGMLLYQGTLSFEKWTSKKAPLKIMKDSLLEKLYAST